MSEAREADKKLPNKPEQRRSPFPPFEEREKPPEPPPKPDRIPSLQEHEDQAVDQLGLRGKLPLRAMEDVINALVEEIPDEIMSPAKKKERKAALIKHLTDGRTRLTAAEIGDITSGSFKKRWEVIDRLTGEIYAVAEIMFVKTGEFSFVPEVDENNQIKVGSLKIAKTDPLRRTIIGLAPLIVGLTIIGLVFNFYLSPIFSLFSPPRSPFGHLGGATQILLLFSVFYLLSSISLTMFSSRKDLEQALIPAVILLIFTIVFWLAGFRLTVPQYIISFIDKLLTQLNKGLGLVVGLNLVVLLLLKGLNSLISALFRP